MQEAQVQFLGQEDPLEKEKLKGAEEDEVLRQHHRHEFEQTAGDSEGQGSLVCCSPWGLKELDMAQQLNDNDESFWLSVVTGCNKLCLFPLD